MAIFDVLICPRQFIPVSLVRLIDLSFLHNGIGVALFCPEYGYFGLASIALFLLEAADELLSSFEVVSVSTILSLYLLLLPLLIRLSLQVPRVYQRRGGIQLRSRRFNLR